MSGPSDFARDAAITMVGYEAGVRAAHAECAMLARQLQSIVEHCDRARFGLVRTSEIYRLIITDPADEENPR